LELLLNSQIELFIVSMVYCYVHLKGDGALLMHGGSMAIIGTSKAKNFKHIVFNNEAHDSVGAQPCIGG
jgi:phosphonopyruvate decarboxylase